MKAGSGIITLAMNTVSRILTISEGRANLSKADTSLSLASRSPMSLGQTDSLFNLGLQQAP